MTTLPQFIFRYRYFLAIIAVLVSLATWYMDWQHIVYNCPYCRFQRTMIGLLGLMFFLPHYFPAVQRIIVFILGFLCMEKASDLIFLTLTQHELPVLGLWLSMVVLIYVVVLWIAFYLHTKQPKTT